MNTVGITSPQILIGLWCKRHFVALYSDCSSEKRHHLLYWFYWFIHSHRHTLSAHINKSLYSGGFYMEVFSSVWADRAQTARGGCYMEVFSSVWETELRPLEEDATWRCSVVCEQTELRPLEEDATWRCSVVCGRQTARGGCYMEVWQQQLWYEEENVWWRFSLPEVLLIH